MDQAHNKQTSSSHPLLNLVKDERELPIDNLMLPSMVKGGFKNLLGIADSEIPLEVRILLSWGPKFVPPHNASVIDYADVMEFLFCAKMKHVDTIHPESCFREIIAQHLFELEQSYSSNDATSHKARILLHLFRKTKHFLNRNPELCVVQADKGNITILMRTSAYREKMNDCISKWVEPMVYRLIEEDFTTTRAKIFSEYKILVNKLRTIYLQVAKNGGQLFPEKLFNMLEEYNKEDCPLSYLYGVVKCHKIDMPCRLMASTLHWYTYPIQQIIAFILTETLKGKLSPQNVWDTSSAAQELYTVPLCEGYQFVKFNVTDMYKRMEIDKIISLVQVLTSGEWYTTNQLMPSQLLLMCLKFTTETASYFSYAGRIYKQQEGLPVGACDSAILATFLLDYLLQFHYETFFPEHYIVYWWKYMDDFLVYMPADNVESFQRTFDNIYSLQLEAEREKPNADGLPSINFVDILIERGFNGIEISMYHEPMASLRMLHYMSHHLMSYKEQTLRDFIQNVLKRTCNRKLLFDLAYYERMFYNNSYPVLFVGEQFSHVVSRELQNISDGRPLLQLPLRKLEERKSLLLKFMERFN